MILITGSTGFIGQHLVERLMQQHLPIRCILTTNRLKNLPWDTENPYAPEIIEGSILDEDIIFRAMIGVHTIIHLENAQWWGKRSDLQEVEIIGTNRVIAAARSARVGRIITVSQLGASTASAFTLLRIKGQVENLIQNSGLAYTIIRSGVVYGEADSFINYVAMMLTVNPIFFIMPGQGEIILHPIYIDDLVQAVSKSIESIRTIDRILEVGGAEYTSLDDMVRTIMRVTGFRRTIINLPPYFLRGVSGFMNIIFPRSLMTSQWLDILASNRTTQIGNMYEYFGFHPRRFEDTLLTYMPKRNYFWEAIRNSFRGRPHPV